MKTSLPVIGSVAAVAAVAVGVTLVAAGSGPAGPRPLHLASQGSVAARDAAMTAAAPTTSGSGYSLVGALPAGQPDDAPAYELPGGPADLDVVRALADALDAGTPQRDGNGWRAGGLFVSGDAGQSWWFAPCAKDAAVSSGEQVACATGTAVAPAPAVSPVSGGSSGSGTAVAPPPPSPAPEPAPVPEATVRTAARPVLDALGLDVADAQVDTSPYGGSATVTRVVGGLEAYGLQTSVQVDRDGHVQGAGGSLAQPQRGDTYPLVTAQAAYDELPPMATMMLCPVGPDGKGCGAPQPVEITGAHLGLMLSALTDGGQALVPAWLFESKGSTQPIPVVAVQKQYLPAPEEPSAKPEPPGAEPGAVPPAPPASDPIATRQAFSFDKAARGAQPDELVVTYGDSSSCVHENVTAQAKEDPTTVYVVLEADARDPDVACTEDYRPVERTLTLQAPLGDRAVVDATTGKRVPLS